MAYLTTKSLPSDVESIVAWSKPHDLTLHITLDPLSDTMMVQLGWMTLVRGVKFGGMSLPREDVLFILDRCASDLRGDIERYIANGEKPKPPWIVRIADSIDRFGYADDVRGAVVKLLASADVDDMPPPVVKHRFSGSPKLCWTRSSRELTLDFASNGAASFVKRVFGGKVVGGSASGAAEVKSLLLCFRDEVDDEFPYYS